MSKKKNGTKADLIQPKESAKSSQKKNTPSKLPVCVAFLMCERVIVAEDDQTLSAIRIVDSISLPPDAAQQGREGAELPALKLLAIIKKGEASEEINLKLICADPTGKKDTVGTSLVTMESDDPMMTTSLVTSVRVINIKKGIYWIELLANDSLIARTPLKVNILDEETADADKKTLSK